MFKPFKSEKNNYTLYGELFGFLFPIVATIAESIHAYGSLTWANILLAQSENAPIWIIDSAPFWLGLFVRLGGVQQDSLLEQTSVEIKDITTFPQEDPAPVIRASLNGEILFANSHASRLCSKLNPENPDRLAESFLKDIKQALSKPNSQNKGFEFAVNENWYSFTAFSLKGKNQFNLYGKDISGLKTTQQALFNERKYLCKMLDDLPISFHLQAPDYSIPFANKSFIKTFGLPEGKKC